MKKEADEIKEKLDKELNKIANTVDPTVPISQNEDENEIVKGGVRHVKLKICISIMKCYIVLTGMNLNVVYKLLVIVLTF